MINISCRYLEHTDFGIIIHLGVGEQICILFSDVCFYQCRKIVPQEPCKLPTMINVE